METLKSRFQVLQAGICAGFPSDAEGGGGLRETMMKNLQNMYDAPRVSELEFCLCKRFTPDEARHLVFFPTQEQFKLYARLIDDPPDGAPADHPQRRLQMSHMCMMYLCHINRWEFVSDFVLHGGLHSLCGLIQHKNLHLRSQAVECFHRVTGNEDFDWFQPPPKTERIKTLLHQQLLSLTNAQFIKNLLGNYANGARVLRCRPFAYMGPIWGRRIRCCDGFPHFHSAVLDR